MKKFSVTVHFADGGYQHSSNLSAENERDALIQVINERFNRHETIVSITVTEKPN